MNIRSRPYTKEYSEGWERVFGKKDPFEGLPKEKVVEDEEEQEQEDAQS